MKKELKGLYDLCKEKGLTDDELLPYFRTIESNLKTKRYGLVWEEQLEDIASDLKNKFPILVEREDLSIKADPKGLTNCLIEGDNYESLTFLKNSGVKVDCIYIDPPYNTGNQDFVYNDKYIDSEDTWRHSSWLSFMNKRLKLAKELLTEDGVIFISIDDNEQAQLKLLCDSIFGEKNFIENFIWERTTQFGRQGKNSYTNTEYIYVYAKQKFTSTGSLKTLLVDSIQDTFEDAPLFNNSNNVNILTFKEGSTSFKIPDGLYKEGTYGKYTLLNDVIVLNGFNNNSFKMSFKSRWSQRKLDEQLALGGKALVKSKNFAIRFLYGNRDVHEKAMTKFLNYNYGTNQQATKELEEMFNGSVFSYSKPSKLLKYLIGCATLNKKDAVILDFFAGSGTTGHAVLELNKEDGGTRKFILCTNNEVSYQKEIDYLEQIGKVTGNSKKELTNFYKEYIVKDEYEFFKESDDYEKLGICRSVTYERLKRVINGYTKHKGEEVVGIPSNLKYYKVKNIDTIINQMEIEDVLIENIVPFVQFKHNVWIQETLAEYLISLTNESESVFVYSNTLYLCDGFYEAINNSVKPTTLYIYDGLFEFLDEERLANVNILSITNEFYKN